MLWLLIEIGTILVVIVSDDSEHWFLLTAPSKTFLNKCFWNILKQGNILEQYVFLKNKYSQIEHWRQSSNGRSCFKCLYYAASSSKLDINQLIIISKTWTFFNDFTMLQKIAKHLLEYISSVNGWRVYRGKFVSIKWY